MCASASVHVCMYRCRCPEAAFTSQPGSEVYLLFLPMYHIYAEMIVQISMYQGDTLTVMAKFDFKQYLNAIQKYKVSLTAEV